MSVIESTRVWRTAARSLGELIRTAIDRTRPIPERMTAIEILKIHVDHILCIPGAARRLARELRAIAEYMRREGYEVSDPPKPMKDLMKINKTEIAKWIREEIKRKEDEPLLDYLDRVSRLLSRILTVFAYTSPSDIGEELEEEEEERFRLQL